MEAPATLEDGNAPQSRRSMRLRLVFYALMFVLIIISALVSIIFCLLHHQQPSTLEPGYLNWDWNLKHCNGMVQARGQNLIIQQSGTYFIYAQLYREKTLNESFTLMLYKDNQILLNQAIGHANGTINFARPFFLQKGEKLYCKKNDKVDIWLRNQTYWGLFKM
uniref:THD domain-containing protein n=1 Tax=Cyanoderma ruficeps TaxID=181631 RepID=A0A8C3QHW2_9PASS